MFYVKFSTGFRDIHSIFLSPSILKWPILRFVYHVKLRIYKKHRVWGNYFMVYLLFCTLIIYKMPRNCITILRIPSGEVTFKSQKCSFTPQVKKMLSIIFDGFLVTNIKMWDPRFCYATPHKLIKEFSAHERYHSNY